MSKAITTCVAFNDKYASCTNTFRFTKPGHNMWGVYGRTTAMMMVRKGKTDSMYMTQISSDINLDYQLYPLWSIPNHVHDLN